MIETIPLFQPKTLSCTIYRSLQAFAGRLRFQEWRKHDESLPFFFLTYGRTISLFMAEVSDQQVSGTSSPLSIQPTFPPIYSEGRPIRAAYNGEISIWVYPFRGTYAEML